MLGLLYCKFFIRILYLSELSITFDVELLAKECIKITKKMKKRKAHFSRAADVELAEISLEQQVLREMMLPQQPAKDKITQDAKQSSSLRLNLAVSSPDSSVTVVV